MRSERMIPLFYELIQVAIGTRAELSRIPSEEEWQILYNLSEKQSIIGICFVGVQSIYKKYHEQAVNLPPELRKRWLGFAANCFNRNEVLNRECKELQEQFSADGLKSCILKGQGVMSYYPEELSLLRQSGDIDVWIDGTWKDVMDYVNARTPNREFDMKHTHLQVFPNTLVEVHWWPSMPINPFYKKSLQAYYREQVSKQCAHEVSLSNDIKINAPDAKFEVVHLMYHIFNHFLYEGIGLRQLMDLYFVLVNGGLDEKDYSDILLTIKRVGLSVFAPAAMWVLCEVFNMPEAACIGNKNEKLGRVFLEEIEKGGSFGGHSKENRVVNESFAHRMKRRWMRRIRLIKYNPWGVLTSPLTKIKILLWKQKVINMYNL